MAPSLCRPKSICSVLNDIFGNLFICAISCCAFLRLSLLIFFDGSLLHPAKIKIKENNNKTIFFIFYILSVDVF